jgi:putative nucleotidyltransferase with HDIG domain
MGAKQITTDHIITRLDELPSLPSIVYELSQVVNDPMSSTADVEKIMANDISLTGKVLRLVNSAYYAIPGGVSSLSRAIAYIGFDTINQLVLSTSILKALEVKDPSAFDLNKIWKHAVGTAIASETIAKQVGHPQPVDLFTCGLLHDMGKVALYTLEPDTMLRIIELCKLAQISYHEAEEQLGIPSHAVIGQALALKWNLPLNVRSVVRYHHVKEHAMRGGLTTDINHNVDIVFLANILIHALKFGNSGHDKVLGAPKDLLERLTIAPDTELKPLIQQIKMNLDHAQDFLRILGASA